jgi:protein SCO1/2
MIMNSCLVSESDKLPIYGEKKIIDGDTLYHTIRDFSFINQDSIIITNATFDNKIYIADFFFTTCPTICPKVKQQMIRIAERFKEEGRLKFLSHSIDTRRDSVPVLKKYANKLDINSQQWHLVTGEKKALYDIAIDYFSIAKEDENAPGGYDHSGYIILIDKNRHLRAYCDGTNPKQVDKFMLDIEKLLKEMDYESL